MEKTHEKDIHMRNLFNGIASKYDIMNTLMTFGRDRAWRRFTVDRANVNPGDTVLDLCCGTGKISVELAKRVTDTGSVTGVDISENMLHIAHTITTSQKNLFFCQGNAIKLPFADSTFNAATVGWGLRNVSDIDIAIKELKRVIKPGGKIVSLDMGKPEMPVFKQAYWLYFQMIIPSLGKIWAKKKNSYTYLYESAKAFLSQAQLRDKFAENGLKEAKYHNLFGGIIAVVEGMK